MAKRLTFVTGNKNKLEEVKKILGGQAGALGIYSELVNKSVDLPELQAATNREITIQKCEEAFKQVQGPVIVEDTGLHFKAMGDLPGERVSNHMVFPIADPCLPSRSLYQVVPGETRSPGSLHVPDRV